MVKRLDLVSLLACAQPSLCLHSLGKDAIGIAGIGIIGAVLATFRFLKLVSVIGLLPRGDTFRVQPGARYVQSLRGLT